MASICVFCGSSPGRDPVYLQAADQLAEALVKARFDLVYGGASVGLMGAVANGVLTRGGRVFGVIPESLATKEIAHSELTDLKIVKSMHERKTVMSELADGFVALPGGIGTFEEFFEIFTWAMLGFHKKPIGVLNVNAYYEPLLALIDKGVSEQFIGPQFKKLITVETVADALISKMLSSPESVNPRWLRDPAES